MEKQNTWPGRGWKQFPTCLQMLSSTHRNITQGGHEATDIFLEAKEGAPGAWFDKQNLHPEN